MKQWKKIVLSIVMFVMIGGMTQALAIDNMNLSPENPPGYENLWNRITRKLGRGICDTAFAFEPFRSSVALCFCSFDFCRVMLLAMA